MSFSSCMTFSSPLKLEAAGSGLESCGKRFGFLARKRLGVPELEMRSEADQGDLLFKACEHAQIGRNQETAGRVDREIDGAAQHDALQHARGIAQTRERLTALLPDVARIDEQAPVGMPRDRDFKGTLLREELAMTTRHRHAPLGIKR